jgi:hypothetical protein
LLCSFGIRFCKYHINLCFCFGPILMHDLLWFKLAVKSRKRFSRVCNSWSLLFQNPNFFKMFRNICISKSHPHYDDVCQILTQVEIPYWNVYLLSRDKFENKVKFDFPPSPSHITKFGFRPFSVLGSVINGILCILHKKNDAP